MAESRPDIIWMAGGHSGAVSTVAYSQDGQWILTGAHDDTVKLWRVSDQKLSFTIDSVVPPHGVPVPPALSPQSTLIAVGAANEIRLYRSADGGLSRVITGHAGTVNSVSFSGNGTMLASGSDDGTIKLWAVSSGTLERIIKGYSNYVGRVLLSPDGTTVASSGRDESGVGPEEIRLWRVADGAFLRALGIWTSHTGNGIPFSFSPDSSLLATPVGCAPNDWCIRFSQVSDGVFLAQIPHGDAAFLTDMAFSTDGTKVAATSLAPGDFTAGFIHIFDMSDGSKLRLILNDSPVSSAAWSSVFSPDGTIVLVGTGLYGDYTFKKWQVSDGAPLPRPTGHQFPVTSLALSPDGSKSVTAATRINGGTVELKCWNAVDGTLLWSSNNLYSRATAFSPNGSFLAIGGSSQIDFLNPTNGTFVRTLTSGARDIACIAFSPDGTVLAAGGGNFWTELSLWRVSDGALLQNLSGQTSNVTALAFSPDGATLASASVDKTVRLWRVSDGAILRTLTNHTDRVNAVAFSHNGLLLVSGGSDQTVRVWRVGDGAMLKSLPHDEGEVSAVAFSPDDALLLTGFGAPDEFSPATGKPIKLWRVSDGTLLGVYDREAVSVNVISFSSDGRRFAYARGDATVVMAYAPLWITDSSRTNGELVFQWQGGSGRYQLQQRTNLSTGTWQDVGAPTTATGVTNSVSGASLFYRVQSLPN